MNNETPKQGELRKKVYDYLASQGFELKPEQHKELRSLLKHVEPVKVEVPAMAPREHIVTCKGCGGKGVFAGKRWAGKARGQFNNPNVKANENNGADKMS